MLCDAWRKEDEGMRVQCAICGFEAEVNPRIAAIYGHRAHRKMGNPPDLWVCDFHFNQSNP